jgi:hypothetical protein
LNDKIFEVPVMKNTANFLQLVMLPFFAPGDNVIKHFFFVIDSLTKHEPIYLSTERSFELVFLKIGPAREECQAAPTY